MAEIHLIERQINKLELKKIAEERFGGDLNKYKL